MFEEKGEYKHYKTGDVYYKLLETIITDDYREYSPNLKVIGEAIFEPTNEPMLILCKGDEFSVCFRDRESDADSEFIEDVTLYQSKKDGTVWVRFTKIFNQYVRPGIKRFTLIE